MFFFTAQSLFAVSPVPVSTTAHPLDIFSIHPRRTELDHDQLVVTPWTIGIYCFQLMS